MALTPTGYGFLAVVENALSSAWQSLHGFFTHPDFSPEAALAATPGIDQHFIPRLPMDAANIDVSVLARLGIMGLKHGKEVTAETHPELYQVWAAMSARAGLKHVPQLIIAESWRVNAFTLSPEEVVVTTGLLKQMNLREVAAVLGHELGHGVSNHTKPRLMAMGIFAGGGAVIGDGIAHRGGIGSYIRHDVPDAGRFRRAMSAMFGRAGEQLSLLGNLAYIMVGASIGGVIANQFSVRSTELDADRKGVSISGDPQGMIMALSNLEGRQHSGGGAARRFFSRLQSGYPSPQTRIGRLREIAATMPPTEPVVASLMPLVDAPHLPVAVNAALVADSPGAQIHAVGQAERVGASAPHLVTAL